MAIDLNTRYKPSISSGITFQRTSHLGFADLNLGVQLPSIRYVISDSISAHLDPRAGVLYPRANFIHIQRSDFAVGLRQTLSIPLFTSGSFQLQGVTGLQENLYATTRQTTKYLDDDEELGRDVLLGANEHNEYLYLVALGGISIPFEIAKNHGAISLEASFGLTDYFDSSKRNSTLTTYALILSANL